MVTERKAVEEIIGDEKLWSNGSAVLFHVTPEENAFNIMRVGINPALSRGKLTASWYVNSKGIIWAIAHCSLRHDIPVGRLAVMTVMLPRNAIKRTSISHMFYVTGLYHPEYCTPAEMFLGDWSKESE